MITFKQFLFEATKTEIILGHVIRRKYKGSTEFFAGERGSAWWSTLDNARTFDSEAEAHIKAAELRDSEPEGAIIATSSKALEHGDRR